MIDTTTPALAFLSDVLREAAGLAMRIQSGMAMANLTKSDFSPVTVADFAVQALVAKRLADALPGEVLVGEERAAAIRTEENAEVCRVVTDFVGRIVSGTTREDVCDWIDRGAGEPKGRYWVLDPIDGTKGYLRGGQYAIALALIEDGVVQLGGLACPNLGADGQAALLGEGALAIAQRGEGSWLASLFEESPEWQRLQVSPCGAPAEARMLRSYESSHTDASKVDAVAKHLAAHAEPVLMDSQAKFIVLAAGHGEILLRLLSPKQPDYREYIWDLAAGSIVLEEAGGRISDLSGTPLDFSTGLRLQNNRGVFASNGTLHNTVLEALEAVGATEV